MSLTSPSSDPSTSATRWRGRLGLIASGILALLGAAASLWAWQAIAQRQQAQIDAEFDRFAQLTYTTVQQRVEHQLDLLAGFAALFRSTPEVSRAEFHAHWQATRAGARFPEVRAVQFSRWVSERERPQFERSVRADRSVEPGGYPGFAIHPPGPRDRYMAVVYNEPMAGNEAAFGHDNGQEPARAAALAAARDGARAQATPPIGLLQGGVGYIVRLPVYLPRRPLDTVQARREAFHGQISGVFQAGPLLTQVLEANAGSGYQVSLLDIGPTELSPHAPIAAAVPLVTVQAPGGVVSGETPAPRDLREFQIEMAGRIWSLRVARPPVNAAWMPLPLALLGAGLGITLLVSGIVARMSALALRASRLAEQLSADARAAALRLQAVLDNTADGILTLDANGCILSANRAAEAMFGHTAERLGRETLAGVCTGASVAPTASAPGWPPGVATTVGGGASRHELEAHRADGNPFPMELVLAQLPLPGPRRYVANLRDLTESKAAEQAIAMALTEMQQANDQREAIVRHAAFALVTTDIGGHITAFNPAAERLLRCDAGHALQRRLDSFFDAQEHEALAGALSSNLGREVSAGADFLLAALGDRDSVEHEIHLQRQDGSRVPVSLTVSALHDEQGAVSGLLHIAYDMSDRRQLAAEMSRLAYHDALTGLANRLQLERELDRALARAQHDQRPLALLFIDLDRFKPINDTHGHAVGDQVLCEVGRRLTAGVRQSDLCARIGGDEFVVLLAQLQRADDCVRVADKLLALVCEPMQLGSLTLHVGASIGVVTYPDGGADAQTLMKGADAAMYEAKQARRQSLAAVR